MLPYTVVTRVCLAVSWQCVPHLRAQFQPPVVGAEQDFADAKVEVLLGRSEESGAVGGLVMELLDGEDLSRHVHDACRLSIQNRVS